MEELLQNSPLYQRKLIVEKGSLWTSFFSKLPAITVSCNNCRANHTFNPVEVDYNEPFEYSNMATNSRSNKLTESSNWLITYKCMKCNNFRRTYLLRFENVTIEETDEDDEYNQVFASKVGQFPAQSIEAEKTMENYLSEKNLTLYKRGIITESQSYGIGAFAYYRQILENTIDTLLDEVLKFAESASAKELKLKITEAKQKQSTAEKIDIISSYLPATLSPSGKNIFKLMYSALSDGIHNKSDEDCLKIAQSLRTCMVFLIKKIEERNEDDKNFANAFAGLQNSTKPTK